MLADREHGHHDRLAVATAPHGGAAPTDAQLPAHLVRLGWPEGRPQPDNCVVPTGTD
ncbi:hypothetical protein [Streptomyces sp. KL116D]|uniref:hypothetical protein n=1 Tax=Streptomyces sp. KL116D TaxID=3045152 RepID=UPI003557668A